MLGLAALLLTAASANVAPTPTSSAPWWERITYTFSGDGAHQSCRYQSSISSASETCDDDGEQILHEASGSTGSFTKITIERRFTPGSEPKPFRLETGDMLLGGQILSLAIAGDGTVRSCELVGASGDVKPPYGCEEARAERFDASASTEGLRQGFMTVLVYGHEEYLV